MFLEAGRIELVELTRHTGETRGRPGADERQGPLDLMQLRCMRLEGVHTVRALCV